MEQKGKCVCVNKPSKTPPCTPNLCDGKECGNAKCKVKNNQPVCECDDPEQTFPSCKADCKCPENQYCRFGTACTCLYGGSLPNCKKGCKRKCGPNAECVIKANGDEDCLCAFGGLHPSCLKNNCTVECQDGKECATSQEGEQSCECLHPPCPPPKCDDCNQGVCALIDGVSVCLCPDKSNQQPNCGKCSTVNCKGGKCVIGKGNEPKCICDYEENSVSKSDFPDCKCTLECGDQAQCAKGENGQEFCRCNNKENNFPDCSPDPTSCDKTCPAGSELKSTGKLCSCVCKSGGIPPKCSNLCKPNNCEKNQQCVVVNGEETCICSDTKLLLPDCKPPGCDPQECKGKCEDNQCVCPDGGTPPNCSNDTKCAKRCRDKEICKIDENGSPQCVCASDPTKQPPCSEEPPPCPENCGIAECIAINGQRTCVCSDRTLKPPSCNAKCKCPKNQFCLSGTTCTCLFGGKVPDCLPGCDKDCGDSARCVTSSGKPKCICLFAGVFPNCEKSDCSKKCKEGEDCVKDQDGNEMCACLTPPCPPNKCKNCNQGKCAEIDGEAKCLCPDGSDNQPKCGECSRINCAGGKCVVDKNNKPTCICDDEDVESSSKSEYPNCKCSLDCGKNGKCVREQQNGKEICICNNEEAVFPACGTKPPGCDETTCSPKTNPIVFRGKCTCACKDPKALPPDCAEPLCGPAGKARCAADGNKICAVIDQEEKCLCRNLKLTPPDCEACILKCPPKYKCVVVDEKSTCKCATDKCPPPCKPEECKGECNGEACICPNGGTPPNCEGSPVCKKKCDVNEMCKPDKSGTPECVCKGNPTKKPPCPPIDPCPDFCGNAKCLEINGKFRCVCNDPNQDPPSCNDQCKCPNTKDQFCKDKTTCTCKYGGIFPKCLPECDKDCGSLAKCMFSSGKLSCVCLFGGVHPDCEKSDCTLKCSKGETCVKTKEGTQQCTCVSPPCPPLKCKNCNQGKCVEIEGEPKCMCHDGSDNQPKCDTCNTVKCVGGKCVISKDNVGKCICEDEDETVAKTKYPNCKCKLKCGNNAKCVVDPQSENEVCICNNGAVDAPECSTNPVDCSTTPCAGKSEPVKYRSECRCVCKDAKKSLPSCTEPLCGPEAKAVCALDGKICGVVDRQEECFCKDLKLRPPECKVCPLVCPPKFKCTVENGKFTCKCEKPGTCQTACTPQSCQGSCDKAGNCVCPGGGVPPACRPVCDKHCNNGVCRMNSNTGIAGH